MGKPSYNEVGGGPATGLANDFVSFLQRGLQTGSFGGGTAGQRFAGADPMGSTMGIGQILDSLLSGEAMGPMAEMVSKQGERDVGAMRARYGASGGMALGTPGAFGEAMVRSETAPKMAKVAQEGQLLALQQLLPLFMNLSGRGIAQREGYLQPPAWQSIAATALPVAGTIIGSLGGPPGAAAGAAIGGAAGKAVGGATPQLSQTAGAQQWMPQVPDFTLWNESMMWNSPLMPR